MQLTAFPCHVECFLFPTQSWCLVTEGVMKMLFPPVLVIHTQQFPSVTEWSHLRELNPACCAITLRLTCPKGLSKPRIASWWTFRHEVVVQMLDFISCSNIAPGLTDDDTTSSFCRHPDPVQSLNPRLWRLFHWLNIQILLHYPDVESESEYFY